MLPTNRGRLIKDIGELEPGESLEFELCCDGIGECEESKYARLVVAQFNTKIREKSGLTKDAQDVLNYRLIRNVCPCCNRKVR